MRSGTVAGGRFEIVAIAGAGGMGQVYRALDRSTGETVALKLLIAGGNYEVSRFAREAQALASLRLPGVVRYIAHGVTEAGDPYLAMEWLSGETLSERLARTRLTVAETIAMASRVATTLAGVHDLGLIHRDLKPSNILLVGGESEQPMLIDFGVVGFTGLDHQLTRTGAVLGTPGYMSPEQARGEPRIDARADVFALGCVLYRCLTGRAAFEGTSGIALLAKVLLDAPPRASELAPEIPAQLDDLITRMLAKDRSHRPRDGGEVAAALASLLDVAARPSSARADRPAPTAEASVAITADERKVVCLVLADVSVSADPGDAAPDATRAADGADVSHEDIAALARRYQVERGLGAEGAASRPGAPNAELDWLDGRVPIFTFSGAAAATDLAERAARCALHVQALVRGAPVVLATGRAERRARVPMGELIGRAVQLLPPQRDAARPAGVRVDELTAGLLGHRFAIVRDAGGGWLQGVQDELHTTSALLGRSMPYVVQERELSVLAMALDQCIEDSTAAGVVVTGHAGAGKSMLRAELVRRLRLCAQPTALWYGKADAIRAGSAFGLVAHALRRAMALGGDAPIEVRRQKILARAERHAHRGLDAPRVAAFLGEIVGVPFPEADDPHLRVARRNPMLMSDQIVAAWVDFLRAECSERPVVLVLEDLHWGDVPTVRLIDAGLRDASDLPLLVVALGRPEMHERFPKLWSARPVHHISLPPLPRRACERLVVQALGDRADAALVARLVDRAGGNPFLLEEQLRAVGERKGDALPETVLAMVQARLEALDDDARRLLRAASIFGETFWESGVVELLGGASVAAQIDELLRREMIDRRAEARLPSQIEYRFRHALVREAAYAMLTESDRGRGHALAGDWLERHGETDPNPLAEHFEKGGSRERAAKAYLRAAEQALRGNDLAAAISRAERGAQCQPAPAILGALRLAQAEAHVWRGELDLAEARGVEAMRCVERGSATWFSAAARVVHARFDQGAERELEPCVREILDAPPAEDASAVRNMCLASCASVVHLSGLRELADRLMEALERAMSDPAAREADAIAWREHARALALSPATDPEDCLAASQAALAAFEQAGDRRNACTAQMNLGHCHAELGDFASAEVALRAALVAAQRMELHPLASHCRHNLGLVLALLGRIDEAEAEERAAVRAAQEAAQLRLEGSARMYLARIALLAEDVEAAEREASSAAELLAGAPPLGILALALRASALLRLGRPAEALSVARDAWERLQVLRVIDEGEPLVRLVYAEALAHNGHTAAAQSAIASARDILLTRAAKLRDPLHRARFLDAVPEHARTLALARAWCHEGPS